MSKVVASITRRLMKKVFKRVEDMKKVLLPILLCISLSLGCVLGSCVPGITMQPPMINSFDAEPPNISAGESSTLSWSVSGGNKVSIDPDIGSVALSGRRTVSPTTTTTYILTASNAAGTVAATVRVVVAAAPSPPTPVGLPVINYFTVSPGSITVGGSSTLSWNVSNATSVTIEPAIGAVAVMGTRSISPTVTTTYTLKATNAFGSSTSTTQVIVSDAPMPAGLPVVNYFTANPPVISAGGTTTLSWSVSNATSVRIDHGVGAVSLVGTVSVLPAVTTNYTLTASNPAGSYSVSITVLVTGVPTPAEKPDLLIQDIWLVGNTVFYKIKNQGAVQSGASTSVLVIDGVVKAYDTVLPLNVDISSTESFAYPFSCSGVSDTIVVHADKDNVVPESNEANNSYSKVFTCPVEKTVTLTTVSVEDGGITKTGTSYAKYAGPCAGDTSANGTRRGFLSFDITSIPVGATIIEAMLDLSDYTQDGSPTYATLGFFEVYHYQYGKYEDLDAADWEASAKLVKGGRFSNYPLASWKWDIKESWDGVSVIQNLINAGQPRCQLRIQFSKLTDGDGVTDFLCFTNAKLTIKYVAP